jgi:hypothetical protein
MAYMPQELKKALVKEARKVIPKNWKVSFAVRHLIALVVTVSAAPIPSADVVGGGELGDINHYYPENALAGDTLKTVSAILEAVNQKNYDNSDMQADYFDVGYYVTLRFGKWDKPFVNTLEAV